MSSGLNIPCKKIKQNIVKLQIIRQQHHGRGLVMNSMRASENADDFKLNMMPNSSQNCFSALDDNRV